MSIGASVFHREYCENSIEWVKSCIDISPDGSVFLAEKHAVTRGRQGRQWEMFPGQILLTVLLKPLIDADNSVETSLIYLHMALTIGVLEVLEPFGVGLKWPNDFVINHKKLGGMIVEAIFSGSQLQGIVIGIGLNITTNIPNDHELFSQATSLYMQDGLTHDIKSMQKKFYTTLDCWYKNWQQKKYDLIFTRWRDAQVGIGKKITVHNQDGTVISGIMSDVMHNGELILQISDKEQKHIPFYVVDRVDIF